MVKLGSFLEDLLPSCKVRVRPEFISYRAEERDIDRLAAEFASARIGNPAVKDFHHSPLPGEVEYEKRRLSGVARAFGVPYEGFTVAALYKGLIKKEESSLDFIHVAFTDQLLATWEEDDRRYHLRAAVFSYPSIISTNGLVEAPAKPRGYYLMKGQYQALGAYDAAAHLEGEFKGRFLEADDFRLSEVAKGYVLQSLANHLSGYPFCPEKTCRLYNAHWQEEMLQAQMREDAGLCQMHREFFAGLG